MAGSLTRRRWPVRLFWAWQALYLVMLLMLLAAVVLDGVFPAGNAVIDALGYPVYLAPVLGPAWLPVTVILGILVALGRRRPASP